MLNKILLIQTRGQILRSWVRRSHETTVPEKYMKFRIGHLDEVLVPKGDWREAYNKQQSKYNKQLVLSIVYIVSTIAWVYNSQVIDLVLPPPYKNE